MSKAYGIDPKTNEWNPPPTLRQALSKALKEFGLSIEADHVLDAPTSQLGAYAAMLADPLLPHPRKDQVTSALKALGLIA